MRFGSTIHGKTQNLRRIYWSGWYGCIHVHKEKRLPMTVKEREDRRRDQNREAQKRCRDKAYFLFSRHVRKANDSLEWECESHAQIEESTVETRTFGPSRPQRPWLRALCAIEALQNRSRAKRSRASSSAGCARFAGFPRGQSEEERESENDGVRERMRDSGEAPSTTIAAPPPATARANPRHGVLP